MTQYTLNHHAFRARSCGWSDEAKKSTTQKHHQWRNMLNQHAFSLENKSEFWVEFQRHFHHDCTINMTKVSSHPYLHLYCSLHLTPIHTAGAGASALDARDGLHALRRAADPARHGRCGCRCQALVAAGGRCGIEGRSDRVHARAARVPGPRLGAAVSPVCVGRVGVGGFRTGRRRGARVELRDGRRGAQACGS